MATKIKDGLFLGDQYVAADIDFIVANKVTHIINCASTETRNCWERIGVRYLNLPWDKYSETKLFDSANMVLDQISRFVNQAHQEGESVLFHSVDGYDRASTCAISYFMYDYQWGLDKVLDFLRSKRPDIRPCPALMKQLFNLDQKLARDIKETAGKVPQHIIDKRRLSWELRTAEEEKHHTSNHIKNDEKVLHHTFVNSISISEDFPYCAGHKSIHELSPKRRTIKWIDSPRRLEKGNNVMRSPFSKQPIPVRPPGPSYRALHAGQDWIDNFADGLNNTAALHSPVPGRDCIPQSILKTNKKKKQTTKKEHVPNTNKYNNYTSEKSENNNLNNVKQTKSRKENSVEHRFSTERTKLKSTNNKPTKESVQRKLNFSNDQHLDKSINASPQTGWTKSFVDKVPVKQQVRESSVWKENVILSDPRHDIVQPTTKKVKPPLRLRSSKHKKKHRTGYRGGKMMKSSSNGNLSSKFLQHQAGIPEPYSRNDMGGTQSFHQRQGELINSLYGAKKSKQTSSAPNLLQGGARIPNNGERSYERELNKLLLTTERATNSAKKHKSLDNHLLNSTKPGTTIFKIRKSSIERLTSKSQQSNRKRGNSLPNCQQHNTMGNGMQRDRAIQGRTRPASAFNNDLNDLYFGKRRPMSSNSRSRQQVLAMHTQRKRPDTSIPIEALKPRWR